jgi:hypothetical protein
MTIKKPSEKPEFFLDDVLGKLFKQPKPKRKADPDYGAFRRLCKRHGLTYAIANDGYVDVEAPDGARFAIGQNWDQRVSRLETILETGYDPGHGGLSWPTRAKDNDQ